MMNHLPRRARTRVVAALALSVAFAVAAATPGWASGGSVLSPSATPHGYSLVDMAQELALFSTSGNNPAYYPDTPFQVLYTGNTDAQPVGTGLTVTGTNSFTVAAGTKFFVPMINVTDSPPVAGVFPTTRAQARSYFFDQTQFGGRDFEIVVDGKSTPIGPAYLAGPITTPPLQDGGGTHMVNLGAFLGPLGRGTHTVVVRGGISGDLVAATYGLSFVREMFTYTVEVVGGGADEG